MAQITHHCGNPPIYVKIRGKTTVRQHDLKGRMPERSEWLLAEGERSVTLGIMTPHLMRLKDAKTVAKEADIRVLQTLFLGMVGIPGVALTLHPRLRALGLKPSAFNLSGWIPSRLIIAANNRIIAR